jgi:hypothetical protein
MKSILHMADAAYWFDSDANHFVTPPEVAAF